MVQRKRSTTRSSTKNRKTSRKTTPKTFVFPYRGLDPIVQVQNGVPLVSGGGGDFQRLAQDPELQNLVEMTNNMAKASDVEAVHQAIRDLEGHLDKDIVNLIQQNFDRQLRKMEDQIMDQIRTLETLMMNSRQNDTGEKSSVRDTIITVQAMEQQVLDSIKNLQPFLSQEVVQQADRLSIQLDQFLVQLDGLKTDIQKTVAAESQNLRDQILNEIEILRSNSVDSSRLQQLLKTNGEQNRAELEELIQKMLDRLGSSSRTDIQDLRSRLQSHEDIQQREQEVMRTLVDELKGDLRSQIDTILQSLASLPRENVSESPILLASQARAQELETELRNARVELLDAQRSLDRQRLQTETLETRLRDMQLIMDGLQASSQEASNLKRTIDLLREQEQKKIADLDQECKVRLQSLKSELEMQSTRNLNQVSGELQINLGSRIQGLEKEIDQARSQTQSLSSALEQEKSKVQDLQGQISSRSEKQQELEMQLSQAVQRQQTISQDLENARVRIQELEREVEKGQAMIQGLQTNVQDSDSLRQTIEALKQAEMEKIQALEDEISKKRLEDLRLLETRLNSGWENQLKDLQTLLNKRISDLESQNTISEKALGEERVRVEELTEALRKSQDSVVLMQASSGEAEKLKMTIQSLQEAEAKRLAELERTISEGFIDEINSLASKLSEEQESHRLDTAEFQRIKDILETQVSVLSGDLAKQRELSQTLERNFSVKSQAAEQLNSLLEETEEEVEELKKAFRGELSNLQQTIKELESRLEDEKAEAKSGQHDNVARINRLEGLLLQCKSESSRQTNIMKEDASKISTLEKDLLTMRRSLSQTSTALEETLLQLRRLEEMEGNNEALLEAVREQSKRLNGIQATVVNILRGADQEVSGDVKQNVESLAKYVERIKDLRSNIPDVIPRYIILEELPGKLELIDGLADKKVNFGPEVNRMKGRIYSYSVQVYELYEQIRRNIYDTELVHMVQGRILTRMKQGMVEAPVSMEDLIPTIVEAESEAKLGVHVLIDVFSPIISTGQTSDNNVSISSALMRAFDYRSAIKLAVEIMPDQGSQRVLAGVLQNIVLSAGTEIPQIGYRLYDVTDMYMVQMVLVDEIRDYLDKSKFYTRDFVYGLEARLILFDAFIKAYLETKTAVQEFRAMFKSKISGRGQADQRMISYVRIRADENMIDPRYTLLLNGDAKDKLQISHQPFVVSSLSMNDSETPFFQHDMYGPFSRVFLPNESNKEIAENVTEMVRALNNHKDVCTLALGPSGSGKTSTLLYFRGSEQSPIPSQGIIPLMLNQLDSGFMMAQVTAFEFAANYEAKSSRDYWKNYPVFESPVFFQRGEYEWVSDGPVEMETFSYATSRAVCEAPSPFSELTRVRTRLGETNLGNFVARLTDTRLNCGTPNNPVSSRTHLFLFVKLMKSRSDTSGPTLIVADLAGREKTFDCSSEAVLENFALNKYYPTLNSLLNNPIGTAKQSPILTTEVGEKFSTATVLKRLQSPESAYNKFTDLRDVPLRRLMNGLMMNTFFNHISTTNGYVMEKLPGDMKEDVSNRFYSALKRLMAKILDENYIQQVILRLETLEKQPIELRNLLEQLDDAELLAEIGLLMKYFAGDNVKRGTNFSSQSQKSRLEQRFAGPAVVNNLLSRMPVFLNAVLLIEYMGNVLKDAPVRVCGYRNLEGEFINRSLDELANLVLVASSFSQDDGPAVHPECLPVTCTFAGLDCLLPKNVPKDMPRSALANILAEGMGKTAFDPMNTVFCTFVVINISKKLSEGNIFRPIFDPAENMIREVTLAFKKTKRDMQFHMTDPRQTIGDAVQTVTEAYQQFSTAYKDEMQLQTEFRQRLEYRGMDVQKMLTDEIRVLLYRKSVILWNQMRQSVSIMMQTLTDKNLLTAGAQNLLELDSVIRNLEQLADVIRIKNQDTAIGVLMFADDIMKRGLQPMVCSTTQRREDILSTTVGWSNVQLNI